MNFSEIVAEGLKEHCKEWGYGERIEKLKADSSVNNFRKLFFHITHTYNVFHQHECYTVEFAKKEDTATVKRCGPDWNDRDIDAVIKIEDVIGYLVR